MSAATHPPTLRQLTTPRLDVACRHWGDPEGRTVLLVHGWPDAARTWDAVAPRLAAAGCSVWAPSLRGCGGTRFRDPAAPRSAQLSALGRDVIELADAIGATRFDVVGHDWGARAAYIAACLWPERVRSCSALSVGWGTNRPEQALDVAQVQRYWYQWYMATDRGAALLRQDRRGFTRHIWDVWCPFWKIDETEFAATAADFDHPDWPDTVLHCYRHRWGWAAGDPSCDELEARLRQPPPITVPTLVLHGADDPCNPPSMSEGREAMFGGPYRRELVARCGHFPQREHPQRVADALLGWLEAHPA